MQPHWASLDARMRAAPGAFQPSSSSNGNAACSQALQYHDFALQTLSDCSDPANQDSELCGYIGEYLELPSTANAESAGHYAQPPLDLINLFINPTDSGKPWANFLAMTTLGQTADLGSVAYIASVINAKWATLNDSSITEDDFVGAWSRAWWGQADTVFDQATSFSNPYDWVSKRDLFFEAANFYFTGAWPQPTQPEAQDALSNMRMALRSGFKAWQAATSTRVIYFTVNYTAEGNTANGTTEFTQLPGFFITPDPSRKLPTALMGTGFDWPKEAFFLQTGQALLDRGYAALYFEGPGQGEALWNAPHLTFTNDWAGAISPFLDYAENQLSQYIDSSRIVLEGSSLGGYLSGRACAGLSDRLAACYPNPARTDLTAAFNVTAKYAVPVWGPIQYVGQQNASLLPPGYAAAFSNLSNIMTPLLFQCTADTRAPEAFAEPIAAQSTVDPDLIYLAASFGGVVSSDYPTLLSGLWEGFRRVSAFTNPDIANISCPVLTVKGAEDDLLGGQEAAFIAALSPATAVKSKLITFNASSGAALHDQSGAPIAANAAVFAFLDPILKGNSSTSSVLSAAGRRLHKSAHHSKTHSDLL
ncbi:hypothetical protein WJX73_009536 [Symbiochloris irregularis]|uniref:Peptidase S9 prolyl oligopeptidase catalytic domain-containing protein n=1 Tax=Symbiochloris irregularis TaxID=706552 RepID=A0AAW1PU86_9CHLO